MNDNEKNDNAKKLKDLFENFNDVSKDSLQEIVGESIKVFENLITKLNSPDEEERKKAMKEAADLRDTLETQARTSLEKSGLDKATIDKFISNPDNFSPEEWQALEGAKKDLDNYEEDLKEKGVIDQEIPHEKPHKSPTSKKKIKKTIKPKKWI